MEEKFFFEEFEKFSFVEFLDYNLLHFEKASKSENDNQEEESYWDDVSFAPVRNRNCWTQKNATNYLAPITICTKEHFDEIKNKINYNSFYQRFRIKIVENENKVSLICYLYTTNKSRGQNYFRVSTHCTF